MEFARKTEINEFDLERGRVDHYIDGLEITMQDVVLVEIIHPGDDFFKNGSDFDFGQLVMGRIDLLDELVDVHLHVLEDEVGGEV